MPGSDTLIVVPKDRFSALVDAFAEPRPEEAWIRSVFVEFGAGFDRFWEPDYAAELEGPPDARRQVFNEALVALLGKGECLDTSLDLLFSVVSDRNPELEPLRRFFADLDFDVDLPPTVQPVEYGLLGVWSAQRIGPPFESARRFATKDGVREYFAVRSYGAFERVRGIPGKDRALEKEWLSDDFWATWDDLMSSLARAASEGSHVALVAWD